MKTVVALYSDSMNDFDELCHDLKTFRVDFEQNEEFKSALQNLSESMRR
jgi:hypothetical protein